MFLIYFISYGCNDSALVFLGGAEASASPSFALPMFITIKKIIILHLFLGVPAATVGGTGTPWHTRGYAPGFRAGQRWWRSPSVSTQRLVPSENQGYIRNLGRSFYTCIVESILTGCITAWFGNSTGNRRALQRVVRTARHIVGGELPSLQDICTRRCTRKARRIIKDSSHPSHSLLSLLPSGRRLRSIRSRTSRLRDSFFPQAIRLMNSQN